MASVKKPSMEPCSMSTAMYVRHSCFFSIMTALSMRNSSTLESLAALYPENRVVTPSSPRSSSREDRLKITYGFDVTSPPTAL